MVQSLEGGQSNNYDAYNMVLQNGLLTSFPKQMSGGSGGTNATIKTFIFAHKWGHGRCPFQALQIDFHSTTGLAIAATMYSYR